MGTMLKMTVATVIFYVFAGVTIVTIPILTTFLATNNQISTTKTTSSTSTTTANFETSAATTKKDTTQNGSSTELTKLS